MSKASNQITQRALGHARLFFAMACNKRSDSVLPFRSIVPLVEVGRGVAG
jgi:hypothetical protein